MFIKNVRCYWFVCLIFLTACGGITEDPINISSLTVEMKPVDGGTFIMGDNSIDDAPNHEITVNGFYISKFEITQKCYKNVMGFLPPMVSSKYGLGDNFPVYGLCWLDAVKFCNKLSVHDGLDTCYVINGSNVTTIKNAVGYRLPTEAEWEFAAKGGNASRIYIYAGSNNIDEVAWYNVSGSIDPAVTLSQIGKKKPNELGLYDMSGNVTEFCWDWYDNSYYRVSPNVDPQGPDSSPINKRVIRGGSWAGYAIMAASAKRAFRFPDPSYETPTVKAIYLAGGIRVVITKNTF